MPPLRCRGEPRTMKLFDAILDVMRDDTLEFFNEYEPALKYRKGQKGYLVVDDPAFVGIEMPANTWSTKQVLDTFWTTRTRGAP